MIEILKAILFGIVEGITEWLPISSTGHLILLDEFIKLQVSEEFSSMFDVVIQLGAILAVIVLFFAKLNPFDPKKDEKQRFKTWRLWFMVILSIIPSGVVGVLLEEAAGGRILGSDLYLTLRQKATVWGMEGEYISSAALDDLECAWGCARGFLAAKDTSHIPVLCVFDSEEVGSNSVQGAASTLLSDTLSRICAGLNLCEKQLLSQSFMVSADNAHAVHPNHPEFADPGNAPVMGGGVVLKFNASQRYTTDGISAAIFRKICAKAEVKVQTFFNRADLLGGSTLGHISLTQVSVPTADIGLPQLAMHSSYETAATADALALEKAMTVFYGTGLTFDGDKIELN